MYTVGEERHGGKRKEKTFETLAEAYQEYNRVVTNALFGKRKGGVMVSIWDREKQKHIEWTDIYRAK